MSTLNEFEDEWIQGEEAPPAPDTEAIAVVDAAIAAASQSDSDYVQAHAELESEKK